MSGGVAYVLDDEARTLRAPLQQGDGEPRQAGGRRGDRSWCTASSRGTPQLTGSKRAEEILASWNQLVPPFVRVMPNDYQRVLEAQKKMRDKGLSQEEAEMAAFEQNSHDVARLGGK